MTRVAVIGANGQVGAELCVLLANMEGIEVIPVCRNRLGSAYLRYRGIACRHGQSADPAQAKMLFGDCDVVVNLALVSTLSNPAAARSINKALLKNIVTMSPPDAKHLYFSTMSVYGDAEVGQRIVFRNSYGQDKWKSEKLARSYGKKAGRSTYIFRLGHVCGELQGITQQIRAAVKNGAVVLPDPERESNTVYVATICEAILKVIAGNVSPGTYDLMNTPQWSWRDVYAYEANKLSMPLSFKVLGDNKKSNFIKKAVVSCLSAGVSLLNIPGIRKFSSRLIVYVPITIFWKIKALYAVKSTASQIGSLRHREVPMDATLRVPVGSVFILGLTPTIELMADSSFQFSDYGKSGIWPPDIPPAGRQASNLLHDNC